MQCQGVTYEITLQSRTRVVRPMPRSCGVVTQTSCSGNADHLFNSVTKAIV